MPFKIIKTNEKGKERLTIIPSGWEHNGILKWPGKNVSLKLLIKNEESTPLPDWTKMKCTVKRSFIPTYNHAEEVLNTMLNCSDTSDYPDDEAKVVSQSTIDYNSKAASLISHQDIVHDNEVIPLEQLESSVLQFITHDQINIMLENQKKIIDNQISILNNQKQIQEKVKTNSRQISNLTVLIEESFKNIAAANQPVVKLGDADFKESESFLIKPITDASELNDLEINLSDYTNKQKLHFQYSLLCNKSNGSGVSCAYKLLDIMFTREFLCKCSWSGGSKGEFVKVAMKAYKNTLNFFFDLVNTWDSTYTHETNENFFKTVLKNSAKRLQIKNLRTSTKRTRIDSTQNRKLNKRTKTEEVKEIIVENKIKEIISENINQEPEVLENVDLEDESLC